MDASRAELVQMSFEQACRLGEALPRRFYAELFGAAPELRSMFKADMAEQGRMLVAALAMVVRSLHDPQAIVAPASALARRHFDYGVQPEHYELFGATLIEALRQELGEAFPREVRSAWIQAFEELSILMRQAAYNGD